MSDIVERLREGVHELDMETQLNPLLDEAADEIERLREALLEIKDMPIRKSQPPWSIHAEYFHIARAALGEGKE